MEGLREDANARKVVFHPGDDASDEQRGGLPNTERLPNGTTVEYRVTIDRAGGGNRITNAATASYENWPGASRALGGHVQRRGHAGPA
ncbi:hypothetical protein ABZ554_22150, partial [Streptomyces sp. NPDC020125]